MKRYRNSPRPICPCCRELRIARGTPPDPDLGAVCALCTYLLANVEDVMSVVDGVGPCRPRDPDAGKGVRP